MQHAPSSILNEFVLSTFDCRRTEEETDPEPRAGDSELAPRHLGLLVLRQNVQHGTLSEGKFYGQKKVINIYLIKGMKFISKNYG